MRIISATLTTDTATLASIQLASEGRTIEGTRHDGSAVEIYTGPRGQVREILLNLQEGIACGAQEVEITQ